MDIWTDELIDGDLNKFILYLLRADQDIGTEGLIDGHLDKFILFAQFAYLGSFFYRRWPQKGGYLAEQNF